MKAEHTTTETPIIKKRAMKVFFLSYSLLSASEVLLHLVRKVQEFVLPISDFLIIMLALVICDWVTGIRAARKRGESIAAAKMGKTIEKMALYFIALLLSEGMRRTFLPEFPITYITALSISITEFKSNIENIESVTGVQIWDSIKGKLSEALSAIGKKK